MTSPTNQLTSDIIAYLFKQHIFAFRCNTQGTYDQTTGKYRPARTTGIPDIIAIPNGRFLGIEVKTGKDRLRDAQIGFHQNVSQSKGLILVVKTMDDFVKQYNQLIY